MQRKTKKILIIVNFALIAVLFTVIFLFVYFSLTEPLTNKLTTDKPVKFMITFHGTEKFLPDTLEAYYVYYERKSNLLKILSVNTDIVVIRKKERARSFKYTFFKDAEKDLNAALTNFYQDVFEMTNNSFVPDYYVTASFESLLQTAGTNKDLHKFISEKSFTERDLQCLNQLEFAQAIMKTFKTRMLSNIKNIRKNYDLLDTNISKLAFINMIMYFKMYDAEIMFFDLPAKYTKTRVEPDKDNIVDLLYTIYYPLTDTDNTKYDGIIEIKNASGKPRMAEKAAWKLRENKFDVLEWSNHKTPYGTTLIKDYKGGYAASKEMSNILGCGKIIVSYDAKKSFSASVFIGEDCEIYDKLDKNSK
ncbi:MAG: LytR C-terminal domain-containing protein [Endomicrobia bacterium]|nr:LytR C-terminal domain-containing protein [Endomicrobiia bacterium]